MSPIILLFLLVTYVTITIDNIKTQCNLDSNSNSTSTTYNTYDIGYPLHAGSDIDAILIGEAICCRGYKSCSETTTIYSNLGNILCLGDSSCMNSGLIWTSDHSTTTLILIVILQLYIVQAIKHAMVLLWNLQII